MRPLRCGIITASVPEVVSAVLGFPASSIILDGEALLFGPSGPERFQDSMSRFGSESAESSHPLTAFFFDCLLVDGTDLRDLEKRLTAEIVGEPEPGVPTPDVPSVLVAEDLAPADTAGLDAARVLALVTERGGPAAFRAADHAIDDARQTGDDAWAAARAAAGLARARTFTWEGTAQLLRQAYVAARERR
mgnify:CR=1 FL=1